MEHLQNAKTWEASARACMVEYCQCVCSDSANDFLLCWGCLGVQLAETHIPRSCNLAVGNSCEIKVSRCMAAVFGKSKVPMLSMLNELISGMGP